MAMLIVLAGIAGGLGLGVALGPAEGIADHEPAGGKGGDGGAGLAEAPAIGGLGPGSSPEAAPAARAQREASRSGPPGDVALSDHAYVELDRQIVVPIVRNRQTEALMLFELALDVAADTTERAYAAEPRLRDAFLQRLLEMSYTGAFETKYTDARVTRELRDKLRADARRLLPGAVFDVLILDILRQEL